MGRKNIQPKPHAEMSKERTDNLEGQTSDVNYRPSGPEFYLGIN